MISAGIVYLTIGERFQREAAASIASLRRVNSHLPVCVVSDSPWMQEGKPPDEFLQVNFRDKKERWSNLEAKTIFLSQSPFRYSLALDTDTFVARDPSPFFDLLEYYDLGARSGGTPIRASDSLRVHPFYSTGAILFRQCDRMTEFFERWRTLYLEFRERWPDEARTFSLSVAETGVRFVTLDAYALFDLNGTITTQAPPYIYHGRLNRVDRIAEEIARDWDESNDYHVRLWLPSIQGALPRGVSRSDPLLAAALLCRRVVNVLRRRYVGL